MIKKGIAPTIFVRSDGTPYSTEQDARIAGYQAIPQDQRKKRGPRTVPVRNGFAYVLEFDFWLCYEKPADIVKTTL